MEVINQHLNKHSEGRLVCTYDDYKGRITKTARPCKAGDVLLTEETLASVAEPAKNKLYDTLQDWSVKDTWDLHTLWTWCVLCTMMTDEEYQMLRRCCDEGVRSTAGVDAGVVEKNKKVVEAFLKLPIPRFSEKQRERLLLLYTPSDDSDAADTINDVVSCNRRFKELIGLDLALPDPYKCKGVSDKGVDDNGWFRKVKENCPRNDGGLFLLRCLLSERLWSKYAQVWILNCFEGATEPLTYLTFFAPAFSSHSCIPNALWHIDEQQRYVLVARRNIGTDEEITFTYTSDSHLLEPTLLRRQDLQATKYFECQCERCMTPCDLSRGFMCTKCPRISHQSVAADPVAADPVAADPVAADEVIDEASPRTSPVGGREAVAGRSGQWFLSNTTPFHPSSDMFQPPANIKPVSLERERVIVDDYLKKIKSDALYQLSFETTSDRETYTSPRITGQLGNIIASKYKPERCIECGAAPDPDELQRAKQLEAYCMSQFAKEDGEQSQLNEDFDIAIMLDHVLPNVGQSYAALLMLERRQGELADDPELASKYALIRHILATQRSDFWELRIRCAGQGLADAEAWNIMSKSLRLVRIIFRTSGYFWDLANVVTVEVQKRENEVDERVRAYISEIEKYIPELAK
ncbi:SET domain protein [Gregarina niphandrodes]|uniref:SET domain protein n=1 Tax=Gregarina niphandrodes TaxID=110365 RepID=A0A023AZR9_GRENI|nr:SET domain protein [Gregarina niphandrodes]EZG44376.1 SET domain protein [Gregarina niphandrodes]|eukprot:XP_011132691.1 SET domain protein [Gregarina niphandrodes]